MRIRTPLGVVAAAACVASVLAARIAFAQAAAPQPCAAPEHRQFDFWIGNWDVFEAGGTTRAAQVRVDPILDGCVLREDYSDDKGLKGQSLSSYEAPKKRWQQTWVTNRGELLVIYGRLEGQTMAFSGSMNTSAGETRVRATWKPEGKNVRETAERSTDAGKTWQPWFDLMFRPAAR